MKDFINLLINQKMILKLFENCSLNKHQNCKDFKKTPSCVNPVSCQLNFRFRPSVNDLRP